MTLTQRAWRSFAHIMSTYPLPKPSTWRAIAHRKTIPVYPPLEPLDYPSLPSQPRRLPFDAPFTLSTHIIPAAHLRTLPYVQMPPPPPADLPKAERAKYNQEIRDKLRVLASPPISSGHPILLWNCLNRYVRKGAPGTGLTLFLTHANGFPKEVRSLSPLKIYPPKFPSFVGLGTCN